MRKKLSALDLTWHTEVVVVDTRGKKLIIVLMIDWLKYIEIKGKSDWRVKKNFFFDWNFYRLKKFFHISSEIHVSCPVSWSFFSSIILFI